MDEVVRMSWSGLIVAGINWLGMGGLAEFYIFGLLVSVRDRTWTVGVTLGIPRTPMACHTAYWNSERRVRVVDRAPGTDNGCAVCLVS